MTANDIYVRADPAYQLKTNDVIPIIQPDNSIKLTTVGKYHDLNFFEYTGRGWTDH